MAKEVSGVPAAKTAGQASTPAAASDAAVAKAQHIDVLAEMKTALVMAKARMAERDALYAALEPFADLLGEHDDDFPDDARVTVTFGRTTDYSLTVSDLRRALAAIRAATEGGER